MNKEQKMDLKNFFKYAIFIMLCQGICFVFFDNFSLSKEKVFVFFSIIIGSLVLLYILFKIQFHYFVFLFILCCGTFSLVLQPIFNIPDEATHFTRAEIVSRGNFVVDSKKETFETIQAERDLEEEMGVVSFESKAQWKKIDRSLVEVDHIAASNLFFLYLPQALGIILAKMLDVNLIWMMWIGRFFNLLFYCLIVSFSIKISPKLKNILFFVAALPMSIQQAASFSPDAMINGSVFLLIGFFIHLYYENEITIKEIILFVFLGIFATLSKITNLFFFGLILFLPFKNINKKKAFFIKGFTILLMCCIALGYYKYTSIFPTPLSIQKYLELNTGANTSLQIQYILSKPIEWIHNFGIYILNSVFDNINSLNCFGPLEYNYSLLNVITIFMFGKICLEEEGIDLSLFQKILCFLIILGNYFMICLALYLSWTGVGSANVVGVQGRYFIPCIAFSALIFANENRVKKSENSLAIDIVIMLLMESMMLFATINYYY